MSSITVICNFIIRLLILLLIALSLRHSVLNHSDNYRYIRDFKHVILYYLLQRMNITMLIISSITIIPLICDSII